MIRSLLYLFLHRVLGLARPNDHIAAEAELEIAVLRHQVAILRRQVKRPIYRASDKAFLAASSRLLRREAWSAFLVRPETRHCCVGYRRGHQGDSRDEITPASSCPTSAPVSVLRVPVPARGHHPGGPLVPALRPVLPGCRGAPCRARGRGRPRQRVPVGPAPCTGVRGGGSSSTAHHRGSLARGRDLSQGGWVLALPVPGHRPVRPSHRCLPLTSPGRLCSPPVLRASDRPDPGLSRGGHHRPVPGLPPGAR